MTEKKIAESINVRINVGNYQHIEITKYAEKQISYESAEEMVKKEDELTDELLKNLIRNMKTIPGKLGKNTNAVAEVEESISKTIPEWLQNSPVPNLAKDVHNKVVVEQKETKDSQTVVEIPETDTEEKNAPVEATTSTNSVPDSSIEDFDDLFEEEDLLS